MGQISEHRFKFRIFLGNFVQQKGNAKELGEGHKNLTELGVPNRTLRNRIWPVSHPPLPVLKLK